MALCRRWHCIYNATVYLVGHPSFEVWGMSVFVCIYVLIHTFCCRHWANIDPVPHWWDCEYNVHYVHSPLSMYTSTCNETSTLRSWTNVLSLFFIQYGCPFVGYKTVKCLIIFFLYSLAPRKKLLFPYWVTSLLLLQTNRTIVASFWSIESHSCMFVVCVCVSVPYRLPCFVISAPIWSLCSLVHLWFHSFMSISHIQSHITFHTHHRFEPNLHLIELRVTHL